MLVLFVFCSSCSDKDAKLNFSKSYSKIEIEYYLQVGFNKKNKIEKWQDDIVVSFDKKFNNQFITFATRIIEEVDSLIPNLTITVSDDNPNIQVFFEIPPTNSYGLEQTKFYYIVSSRIKESKIWLSPQTSTNMLRFNFCHELFHSLGFFHAKNYKKTYSLMGIKEFQSIEKYESYFKAFYSIPTVDKKAIGIHYNENIRPGMKKKNIN